MQNVNLYTVTIKNCISLTIIPIQETRQRYSAALYICTHVFALQSAHIYIKMRVLLHSHSFLVGVARLERSEPCRWKCSRRNSDCCLPIASLTVIDEPLRETKRHGQTVRVFCLVGVARLELAALRSRTVRATKLRYTPLFMSQSKLIAYAIYINLQFFATKLR